MAVWQYRCVSCGGVHEVSVRPAGEAMLLRCLVTRQWNWHEPAAFLSVVAESPVARVTASAARQPRAVRRTRTAAKARPASGPRAAAKRRTHAARAGGSRGSRTRAARGKGRRR